MRRLLLATLAGAVLTLGVAVAAPAFAADPEPTVQQIYDAADAGHLDQAQQLMNQVLADHPQSARAHFVQAELYARGRKIALARSELATAEQLKPGLPFEKPAAVQELKGQLGLLPRTAGRESAAAPVRFPVMPIVILLVVIGVLYMLFRRRTPPVQYSMGGTPGAGGAPTGYGPGPGYGPAPMGGGGIGSGIAGGLASGLAVGAGVVAGEEIAHHFLDGGRSGGVIPPADAGEAGFSNSDMGGSDFGMNDPGSGWDGGGGGGDSGGGGGDWS